MSCPYCKSLNISKKGLRLLADGTRKQRYFCIDCKRRFTSDTEKQLKINNPRLLYVDIETAPNLVWAWGTGKYYIRPEDVEQEWFILSWAAKWVCGNEIFGEVLTSDEALRRDDKRICNRLWQLFDDATVVLGHNLRKFDIKKTNWRFLVHGYTPPMAYSTVDTLVESRNIAAPISHKLDYLATNLGINGGKQDTGFDLWKQCVKGHAPSLEKMFEYNKHDVLIGEDFYMIIRPWIKNHPNMGLYYDTDEFVCRNCGNTDVTILDKPYYTPANAYKSWMCNECGANGRTAIQLIDTEKRRKLLR